jgi:hypothetical protein
MRESRPHWRDDLSELPAYFAAAWQDCRPIHLEAEEWARNYYDEATELTGSAQQAIDLLRQQGYGDLASLMSNTARRGENLTMELVEAAKSFIATEMTVTAVPKGDSALARASKTVNRLVEGVMEANDFFAVVANEVFDEMGWHPVALCKVYPDPRSGEIKIRSVDPMLTCWALSDGADPQSFYEQVYISRSELAAMYPRAKDIVGRMQEAEPPIILGVDQSRHKSAYGTGKSDTVCIVDCWTKSLDDDHPGKHVVMAAVGGKIDESSLTTGGTYAGLEPLNPKEDQEWPHPWLPYPSLRWKSRRRAFHGQSIAKIVAPNHARVNWYTSRVVQMLEASVPRLMKHKRVDLVSPPSKGIMDTIEWDSKHPNAPAPTIEIAGMVPKEILDRISQEEKKAYDKIRINRDAARGEQPKGINTAPGQRAWDGTVNRALRPYQTNWEQFLKQVGRAILGWAPVVYAERGAVVRAPGTDMLEELPAWGGLDPDGEGKYDVQVKISSGLSGTLAAGLEETAELEARGMLSRVGSARALSRRLPEVRRFVDEAAWTEDLADTILSQAMEQPPKWRTPLAVPEFVRDFLPKVRAAWGQVVNSLFSGSKRYQDANAEMLRKLLRVTEWRASKLTLPAPVTPVGPSPDAVAPSTV